MRGLVCAVLVVATMKALFVEPEYNYMVAAADTELSQNNNESEGCVGVECLVGDEVEEDLFSSSDSQGLSAMLAGATNNHINTGGSIKNAGRQTPDCVPKIPYGSSSCINSPQLNSKGARCDISNRAHYCQRRAPK